MSYLHGIGCKNFRVFEDYQNFKFAPITILTGPNGSGKSSLKYAVYFLQKLMTFDLTEFTEYNLFDTIYRWFSKTETDDIIQDIGGFKNFPNRKSGDNKVFFSMPFMLIHHPNPTEIVFEVQIQKTENFKGETSLNEFAQLESFSIRDKKTKETLFQVYVDKDSKEKKKGEFNIKINFTVFYENYYVSSILWDKTYKPGKPGKPNESIFKELKNINSRNIDYMYAAYEIKNNNTYFGKFLEDAFSVKINYVDQLQILSKDKNILNVGLVEALKIISLKNDLFETFEISPKEINCFNGNSELSHEIRKNDYVLSKLNNLSIKIYYDYENTIDMSTKKFALEIDRIFNKKNKIRQTKIEKSNKKIKFDDKKDKLREDDILAFSSNLDGFNGDFIFKSFIDLIFSDIHKCLYLTNLEKPIFIELNRFNFKKRNYNVTSGEFSIIDKASQHVTEVKDFLNENYNRSTARHNLVLEAKERK
jgi:AAA15 family ATPase/GTPase